MPPVQSRHSREFSTQRYVYAVITSRARGLSIGVNVNPDKRCNFDCIYCEVAREKGCVSQAQPLNLSLLTDELTDLLLRARSGRMREFPTFSRVPAELLQLRGVALSGDGEPTLSPEFPEILSKVLSLRRTLLPFKLVVITNGTGLHLSRVSKSLALLDPTDEIWIKLDVGTEEGMRRVNGVRSGATLLRRALDNIVALGKQRPIVIQSLFCEIDGAPPSEEELDAYLCRLCELKAEGAQISLVQVYSVSRPPAKVRCTHLPLPALSRIARRIRTITGLKAEVF